MSSDLRITQSHLNDIDEPNPSAITFYVHKHSVENNTLRRKNSVENTLQMPNKRPMSMENRRQ